MSYYFLRKPFKGAKSTTQRHGQAGVKSTTQDPEEPEMLPEEPHHDEGHHPQFDEPNPIVDDDPPRLYYCDTHTSEENKCCGMGMPSEDAETCVHYCDTHTGEEEPCCDCCPAPNGQPARYGAIAACRVQNGGEEVLLMSPPPPRSPPPPPSLPPLKQILQDIKASPSPSAEEALDASTTATDAHAVDVTASTWDSGLPRFAEGSIADRMRAPLRESRPEPWRGLQPDPQESWAHVRPWDNGDSQRPPRSRGNRREKTRRPWPAWWAKHTIRDDSV